MVKMPEKILCAAVWYSEIELKKSDVPPEAYLPVNVDKGAVFCGFRHAQCIYTKYALTGLRDAETGPQVQGFLTNHNRFVTREEALVIALREKQVIDLDEIRGNRLFSEDLY